MALVRWKFTDPVNLDEYEFEINPSAGGSPAIQKTFQYQNTSAPDGKTIIFEGRDQVQKIEFSGRLLSEAQYTAFETWANKRYQVQIEDDLGRSFYIIIESFTPTRVRRRSHPWTHDYSISATIVDWS